MIPFVLILGLVLIVPQTWGENTQNAPDTENLQGISEKWKGDPVEKVGPGRYRIGKIEVDAVSREIRFAGEINQATGLVEVVVCAEYGKTHESLIVTKIRPLNLHIALLLLGLRDGFNPGWPDPEGVDYEPEEMGPPGSQVEVFVGWDTAQGPREVRAERFFMDIRTEKPLPETPWVFIGSYRTTGGGYAADSVGSIITNYHCYDTILDCPLKSARSDEYTFINHKIVPPLGTETRIRIAVSDSLGEPSSSSVDPKNSKGSEQG